MKAKMLSFAFIYFCESGLFNELRAKKRKNSARVLTRVMGCAEMPHQPLLTRVHLRPAMIGRGHPFADKWAFPIISNASM
jgi:hypothetical protein